MTQKAYIVVWHMKGQPEEGGRSHLISDRGFARLRAVTSNLDYPARLHWVEEVDLTEITSEQRINSTAMHKTVTGQTT